MRYLIVFSYDGSLFHGFQRQNDVKNVQGTIENAVSTLLNEEIEIKGSGRTDAGVHALNQTAHFECRKKIPYNFKKLLNNYLKSEIKIKKIKKVPKEFHARFSVKEKTYKYVINVDKRKINNKYYFTSFFELDIKKMKDASKIFLGAHDFENFVSGKRDDYTTFIKNIKITKKKSYIILEFTGAGFYRYMVRHLAGALYDVGRGKIDKTVIDRLLNKRDQKELSVLPAEGLYLIKVKY